MNSRGAILASMRRNDFHNVSRVAGPKSTVKEAKGIVQKRKYSGWMQLSRALGTLDKKSRNTVTYRLPHVAEFHRLRRNAGDARANKASESTAHICYRTRREFCSQCKN